MLCNFCLRGNVYSVINMKVYIAISVFCLALVSGQSFGQNKVQYREFDWSFIQTPHFDIYFYGDQQELANFTAEVSEDAYEQISLHLRWDLRKRVSIMVYNSHNEFQQTNIVATYMVEGVGGVTELFKNRVVFPFEGNYEQFRHVIHHELVHAMVNDMVYGGNMQNLISSRVKIRVPIWCNEGLAEFLSLNWDTKSDMVLRDIAIHERIPTVNELNYFMAYKGGQSLWKFIADKYGREKIGDVFRSMKRTQNAEKGYEKALGMNFKDLTDQWHKYLKKNYWPDINNRDPIEEISEQLTDHKKSKNFYHVSPALSPDGSMVAALSDQSGYFDIVLFDAMTGKKIKTLVNGSRSVNFEELKWLQPGISWSPDNNSVVFAAKAGKGDVLHIIDIDTKKSKTLEISDLDGVFSAAWSPLGNEIAFIGNKGRASDIYIYNLEKNNFFQLTNDVFSDSYPSWSPNGEEIVFVSDRGENISGAFKGKMVDHNYSQSDLYIISTRSKIISRITKTEYNESHPVWMNTDNFIIYTADYNGVWNLFKKSLIDDVGDQSRASSPYAITNVLTGLQQPTVSKDDQQVIFAGYVGAGWDLYSMVKPLEKQSKIIAKTQYIKNKDQDDESIPDLRKQLKNKDFSEGSQKTYSKWVFAQGYENYNTTIKENDPVEIISLDSLKKGGEYIPQSYKTRFTLDLVSGNLQISNVFGTTGMTYFSFSDILGDHQIAFGTEMVLTLENSDYFLQYAYLKNRRDYYFTAFQNADFFNIGYDYYTGLYTTARLRHYGIQFLVSNPFNRYNRIDLGFSWHNISYSILRPMLTGYNYTEVRYEEIESEIFSTILPTISWVYDNSVFGFTGPIDGFRKNTSLTFSPGYGTDSLDFQTMKIDARKYWRFGRDYTLAVRTFIGKSFGPDKQKFFMGGIPYMLAGGGETNGKKDTGQYRDVLLDTSNTSLIQDIYFTEYAFPIRGARFAERFGSNALLANIEMRFPFINYLALGFPLKVIFGNIRGHAFLDIGAAWDDGEFSKDGWPYEYGKQYNKYSPWVATLGLGTKINLGYFLLRIEAAWDKNPNGYSKPQWYFSLGPDW